MAEDLPCCVPGLDELFCGGLPPRHSIVVTGQPGSGKTILCSQVAFSLAALGHSVVFATVTSESQDKIVAGMASFSFFDSGLLGEKVFFVSVYPWLKKGAKETRDLLFNVVRERKAKLLVLDGLRSIRDLWQDEAMLREFFYELNVGLATVDCVGIYATEYPTDRLMELPEATTVDGILAVSTVRVGSQRFRRIELVKLRGRETVLGEHPMFIDSKGITVIPRLEAVTKAAPIKVGGGRAEFGLLELDQLLEGGVPHGSTTLVAGSTGIGKTLLGTSFVAAGARTGERGMILSFFEPSEALIARAERIGLRIAPLLAEGKIDLEYRPPLEWEADKCIDDLLRRIRERNVKRVLIDGISALDARVVDKGRTSTLLTALVVRLRDIGVTTMFTKEVSKLAGPEIDFSDTPIAVALENFIFLRFVELQGRLHRVLSILKMRDSRYGPDLREFTISQSGIRVLAPIRSAEGLLTGLARPIGASVGARASEQP